MMTANAWNKRSDVCIGWPRRLGLNHLIADESTRDSDRLDHLHERFVKPFRESIEPTIERLVAGGRIPDVRSHIIYFAISGPALALTQDPLADRMNPAASPMAGQDRNSTADALARLVLQGLPPPSHREKMDGRQ